MIKGNVLMILLMNVIPKFIFYSAQKFGFEKYEKSIKINFKHSKHSKHWSKSATRRFLTKNPNFKNVFLRFWILLVGESPNPYFIIKRSCGK